MGEKPNIVVGLTEASEETKTPVIKRAAVPLEMPKVTDLSSCTLLVPPASEVKRVQLSELFASQDRQAAARRPRP
jgi:hypothetical protein